MGGDKPLPYKENRTAGSIRARVLRASKLRANG
jgi:hypothetical protein